MPGGRVVRLPRPGVLGTEGAGDGLDAGLQRVGIFRKREAVLDAAGTVRRVGTNVSVADGFICGFGDNLFIGDNVSINYRCMFIDCNTITIGNDVLIAPGVQLQTAAHPVELAERLTPGWKPGDLEYRWRTYARPIVIGDGCWIGANVTVLPGVTIGRGSVIGAGSVVNKDIPPTVSPSESPAGSSGRSMNMPVPCRVIRRINEYAHPLPGHPEDQ